MNRKSKDLRSRESSPKANAGKEPLRKGRRTFNSPKPAMPGTKKPTGKTPCRGSRGGEKIASQSLHDHDMYKDAFEQSTIGRSFTSPQGRITVNRAFCEMLGYTAGEMQGFDWKEISHPDDIPMTQKVLDRLLSGKAESDRFEKRYVRKDGSVVIADVSTTLKRDARGRPLYFMTSVIDITERRQAENSLREANLRLVQSNQDLEQFAYVASHDLQEPLRMISSYTQLLEARYRDKLDQDGRDFIAFAVDGAKRLQRLIQDLLKYSRVTTRGQPFLTLDSQLAFREAVNNLQVVIQESGALISSGDLPSVSGDRGQVVRLYQNLLANSIKFRRPQEAPRIHVGAAEDPLHPGYWMFKVSDNGIGIDPRHQERIFDIFQRLHPRREYPGTGIGLAICRRIVERHGGRIWVESQAGQGATFCFTLPGEFLACKE